MKRLKGLFSTTNFMSPVIYLTLKCIWNIYIWVFVNGGWLSGDRSNKQTQNTITGHIVVYSRNGAVRNTYDADELVCVRVGSQLVGIRDVQ